MTLNERPARFPRLNSSTCELAQSLRKSKPVCENASIYKLRHKTGRRASFGCSRSSKSDGDTESCFSTQSDTSALASTSCTPFLIGPDSAVEAKRVHLEDVSNGYHDGVTWTSKNSITTLNLSTNRYVKYEWVYDEVYDALMAIAFDETSSYNVVVGLIIDLPFSEKTIRAFFDFYLPKYSPVPIRHLTSIFWHARMEIDEKHNQNMFAMKREARRSEMIQAHEMYNMKKAEGANTPEAMQFVCAQISTAKNRNISEIVGGDRLGSKEHGAHVDIDPEPMPQARSEHQYCQSVPVMLRPIHRRLEQSHDGYTVTLCGGVGCEAWTKVSDRGTDSSWTESTKSTDSENLGNPEGCVSMYHSTNDFEAQFVTQNHSPQNSNASINQPYRNLPTKFIGKVKGKRKQTELTISLESPPKKVKSDIRKPEGSTRGIAIPKKRARSRTTGSLDLTQPAASRDDSKAVDFFLNGTRQGYSSRAEKRKVVTEFYDEE